MNGVFQISECLIRQVQTLYLGGSPPVSSKRSDGSSIRAKKYKIDFISGMTALAKAEKIALPAESLCLYSIGSIALAGQAIPIFQMDYYMNQAYFHEQDDINRDRRAHCECRKGIS